MSSFVRFGNPLGESSFQNGRTNDASTTSGLVTIPDAEYQRLLQASHHFTKLKESLLNGGLSQATLEILIYGAPDAPTNTHQPENETSSESRATSHGITDSNSRTNCPNAKGNYKSVGSCDDDFEDNLTDSRSDEKEDYGESSRSTGSSVAQGDQRTIMIRGLPDRVTHKDIVDIIKGGSLLHVYLRARDHTVSVSFVEEAAAQEFLQHTKNYGLYLAGKRLEVSWNDRQFYLPPFVRSKINNGASRNLVIYNVNPNITEELIREDLEHIHNLIVISVKFRHGSAYISTNSVHNALFARSCMMSRFTYKGMKIAFYPDECREPLSKIPTGPKKEFSAPSKKPISAPNRFHLLSLDGADDDENEDHHDGLSTNLNDSICWADNSVSA